MESNGEKTSRRDVLKLGAYGLGAIGAMSANAQVATKAQQKAVMRQQTPKDGKQCIGCQHYEVASSRRTVDGEISANGYCSLFAKKPA